jgi:hypothetical protein
MTLVVARIRGNEIAIASDTLLSEHDRPLPAQRGTIKSCMLPGEICVSFSNSPELAERDFSKFASIYPDGADYQKCISFFEKSSDQTGNEYIISFQRNPKIIKISEGNRQKSAAHTIWIGDKFAYEYFREYEARIRRGTLHGRAIPAAVFADEPSGSTASNLQSTMRHVVSNKEVSSVGGFVSVISSRGNGFRYSSYCEMLYNWPAERDETYDFRYEDPISLKASGENSGYSVAQISPMYVGANFVGYYYIMPKLLFLFYGTNNGLPNKCATFKDVEPNDIYAKLNDFVGFDMRWLMMILSAPEDVQKRKYRNEDNSSRGNSGSSFSFFVHANTFPKTT